MLGIIIFFSTEVCNNFFLFKQQCTCGLFHWTKVKKGRKRVFVTIYFYSVGLGGVSQNLSLVTYDSFCYKLLKSLLLIGYQQLCHWFLSFVIEKLLLLHHNILMSCYGGRCLISIDNGEVYPDN